jgi:hypothetical protein
MRWCGTFSTSRSTGTNTTWDSDLFWCAASTTTRADVHSVLALCPFARRWADLHPGYHDVDRRPRADELTARRGLIAADHTMRALHHDAGNKP